MDFGIEGKTALVTGGSRGLGRQAALSLASEGVNVAICGRTQDMLDKAVAEIEATGASSIGILADVSDPDSIEPLHKQVVEKFGPIDILFNNVGGTRSKTDIA